MRDSNEQAISEYLSEVARHLATGHAAEHAYRPALERLMERIEDIDAVNDPKRSEYGAPDMIFLKSGSPELILGWAEAKDIAVDLDKAEKSEQLQRYSGYSNLYLTNYIEFRFYTNGRRYDDIKIAELNENELTPLEQNYGMLANLLAGFLGRKPQPIVNGTRLAEVMGGIAHRIRSAVHYYLSIDSTKNDELLGIYDMIRETLVHDLDKSEFADMYAQTLVYGLFAARYNDSSPDNFSRTEARELVPASNPFLRQFFDHITGANFDSRLARIVDELCAIFAVSSVREIVHQHLYPHPTPGFVDDEMDPIIHFYEDFLKAYNPEQRKRMGAYYTPLPIVRFMVRMVDTLLKEEFGLPEGLSDTSKIKKRVMRGDNPVEHEFHKVQILDPAVGTATFLNEIIHFVHRGFEGQEGRWPSYVKQDLVPRLHGFEIMMAPYTVAHLKLGLTLQESGVADFGGRLGVYLTNTLEEGADVPQSLFHFGLADAVAQEAMQAGEIKTERPIMVMIGNPPYAGISSNETDWANALVADYKVEPGGQSKLRERKHWLNDDYVKFIAFAESMIRRSGSGIVAMITNHGYLDNPTFRGMRWRLTQTFDLIYVLDLHGNAKKKEVPPGGGRDQNVFDIRQGVAIMFGVVTGAERPRCHSARVFRSDLWGDRGSKFDDLNRDQIQWHEIPVAEPMYYFVDRNTVGEAEFAACIPLAELMPVNVTGMQTSRDAVVVDLDRDVLVSRIERFKDPAMSDAEARSCLFPGKKDGKKYLAGDSRGWKLTTARMQLLDEATAEYVETVCYRPFDSRYVYYSTNMVDWPRSDVLPHLLHDGNFAIAVGRQGKVVGNMTWNLVSVVDSLADVNYFYRGGEQVHPLYLYATDGTRTPNIDQGRLRDLTVNLSCQPAPEDVLDYCYGALHSPAYREKYSEFLKSEAPRIPIPASDDDWAEVVGIGHRLRDLHLMESAESQELITTFPVAGSDEVGKPRFEDGKVWINDTQYFDCIPEASWDFYVGGYQPAQKWLKDRRGRVLTHYELVHYQRIIAVLVLTDEIMSSMA